MVLQFCDNGTIQMLLDLMISQLVDLVTPLPMALPGLVLDQLMMVQMPHGKKITTYGNLLSGMATINVTH